MAKKRKQVAKKQRQSGTATPELVTWALHGIQQAIDVARARLEDLEGQARKLRGATRAAAAAAAETFAAQASALVPTTTDKPAKAPRTAKKRKLSADARRRIADAQKRRWAKVRATKTPS
jgi:hypothetical protein